MHHLLAVKTPLPVHMPSFLSLQILFVIVGVPITSLAISLKLGKVSTHIPKDQMNERMKKLPYAAEWHF